MKLGIISDTHGYLDARIHPLFQGVDAIIHAGDVGKDDILVELETIAPVTAVRGNMDRFGSVATHHEVIASSFNGVRFFIVHDIGSPYAIKTRLLPPMKKYMPHVIIFGHTHKPFTQYIQDILYFNPGSASQGRGGNKRSVGIIDLSNSRLAGKIFELA